MRAAVQGEKQLFSMPNNTAIMVSFAACFALRLSTQISGATATSSALAPSVRTLIEETADMLGRIGNITRHRNGMCGLYAKYLRILVKKAATGNGAVGPAGRSGNMTTNVFGRKGHPGGLGDTGGGATPRMTHGQIYSSDHKPTTATASQRQGSGSSGMGYAVTTRKPSAAAGSSMGGYPSTAMPSAQSLSPYDTGVPAWSAANPQAADLFPFSSMSGDQIVEALNRAGSEFDTPAGYGMAGGGDGENPGAGGQGVVFTWDDGGAFDWMPQWSNWPDFGF